MDYGLGTTNGDDSPLASLFSALAREPRRHLLGVLYEHDSASLSLTDCATRIASREAGLPRPNVSDDTVEQTLVSLYHVHLPVLADAGLIEYDIADAGDHSDIALTSHRAYRDSAIIDVIESSETARDSSLDALFDALSDPRRRRVLACLNHSFQAIHLETLARDVVRKELIEAETAAEAKTEVETEAEAETETEPDGDTDTILKHLRHTHIPSLSEAGLIDFDPETETAAYNGHPNLCVSWLHSVLNQDFRTHLSTDPPVTDWPLTIDLPTSSTVQVIDGRDGIVAYSQSLLERAEEELFSVFTSPRLLESGCFARVMDASRRGVDVYLGTTDPVVRELVRENAPAISLWEPTDEWLTLSVQDETVGRLLFADRESLVFGTLREQRDDHRYAETALVGDRPAAEQLLGPHLDRIDQKVQDLESAS
ncbi:hypothetical protein C483_04434 [Natrialba hulunbeirensis JCM 10989]|uniref:DUF7344 domain-containing protein n=1 Tax=Natrialba hulunbeirensis JCM 10989 TaxID=1227493 RepID=M0A6B4_9EURY|nr:hypothetical protein [Natrialba hulunbeirensis]ELY93896.1 hypothetical protein C483_04434 [Natrialba hulunbeirensis JCM 10989]